MWRSFAPQFGPSAGWDGQFPVLGEVALWGDVVEAERGWRGQYAYPARLFVPMVDRKEDQALEIAEGLRGYGVDVTVVAGGKARDILVAVEEARRAATVSFPQGSPP
jgi:hypothetical protein